MLWCFLKKPFSEMLKFVISRGSFFMFHLSIVLKLLIHENIIFEISESEK